MEAVAQSGLDASSLSTSTTEAATAADCRAHISVAAAHELPLDRGARLSCLTVLP